MNPSFEIQGRKVGYDYDPLVIAELGINHNGSLEEAKKIVDSAARAGVELIKHQTHVVDDEMSSAAKSVIPGNADVSIYEIMEKCALSEEEEIELQKYVQSKGIIFISTPFSRAAAKRLERMKVPAYKIGSGECNNYPLVDYIASLGKPVILSTGMNTIDSIGKAVSIIEKHKVPYALLHCTNVYPTPPNLVRLGAITELKEQFPNSVLGLSDHTTSNYPCLAAVALGAAILERHFTDTMERVGPDIICSMDEQNAKSLIQGAQIIKQARGGSKGPVEEEKRTIDFAYATVVSIKELSAGELFTEENLWVKRPGTGEILAENYRDILGKRAARNISVDEHIKWNDIK